VLLFRACIHETAHSSVLSVFRPLSFQLVFATSATCTRLLSRARVAIRDPCRIICSENVSRPDQAHSADKSLRACHRLALRVHCSSVALRDPDRVPPPLTKALRQFRRNCVSSLPSPRHLIRHPRQLKGTLEIRFPFGKFYFCPACRPGARTNTFNGTRVYCPSRSKGMHFFN